MRAARGSGRSDALLGVKPSGVRGGVADDEPFWAVRSATGCAASRGVASGTVVGRTARQRVDSAIGRLESEPNVWVATGSAAGVPHMVPLSLSWNGRAIVVATPTDSPTVRNAVFSGRARASLDSAQDVVIADADVAVFDDADEAVLHAYIDAVGWDPRDETGAWSMLILTPQRVQAWNSVREIDGRTIMRDGVWATD